MPARRRRRRRSTAHGIRGRATTRRTPRCCWRRCWRRRRREIAERIGVELKATLGDQLERAEVAGPGFVNLWLSDAWHRRALRSVLAAGERFGAGGADPVERISIEFVSANPTGPLVAASGRHAAYGDALARILEHHGHSVTREYYFNDAGNQIRLLGASVRARARGEEVPEGGYQGSYVADLAAAHPGRPRTRASTSCRGAPSTCCWPRSRPRSIATASCSTCSSASGRCTRAGRARCSTR